jgi:hypothetical protein
LVRYIGPNGNWVRKLMLVLHVRTDFGVVRRFPEGVQADDHGVSHVRAFYSR